jgi:hypothetical protein
LSSREIRRGRRTSQTPNQELEKEKIDSQDDHQTEEYEDMKSQLLANKITVQQNKKLNEL